MIPGTLLLKALPFWRWLKPFLPHLAIAALLIFAVWRINQAGYNRAVREAERRELTQAILIKKLEQRIAAKLTADRAVIDATLHARLQTLDHAERALQPTIIRELQRETRLSDPAAGLTPGLLEAVNKARNAANQRASAEPSHAPVVLGRAAGR